MFSSHLRSTEEGGKGGFLPSGHTKLAYTGLVKEQPSQGRRKGWPKHRMSGTAGVTWARFPLCWIPAAMQNTISNSSTRPAVRQQGLCFSSNSISSPENCRTQCPRTSTPIALPVLRSSSMAAGQTEKASTGQSSQCSVTQVSQHSLTFSKNMLLLTLHYFQPKARRQLNNGYDLEQLIKAAQKMCWY